jgi:hypothetical protein
MLMRRWTDSISWSRTNADGRSNIGRFATIRSDLKAGRHTVTCELLEETSDPDGGHEFRLISMMRLVAR